ncbi:MAG: response regulator [Deltaproteobacteria bacterium]|nr:response regulator [Deltaproteobacteria bacterium]
MSILIVDDSPVSRELLSKTLKKWGQHIITANDGLDGLEKYRNNDISIVITDWVMPGMDGLALCEEVRRFIKNKYTYIIIVTSKDQTTDIKEALNKGADDYITKPIDMERLKVSIKTARRIISLSENLNSQIQQNNILIENMKEGLLRIDSNGLITFVNNRLCTVLGYSRNELTGKDIRLLFDNEQREEMDKKIEERKKGISESYELRYVTREGDTFFAMVSAKPVFTSKGAFDGIVAVITDISAIRNAEQERKLIESQLRQSDKMASIGQLAAGIAHEINNPTGFVSSNLNTLAKYIKDYNELIDLYQGFSRQLEQAAISNGWSDLLQKIRKHESSIDMDFLKEDIINLIEESREGTGRIKKIVQDLKDFAHPGEDKPKFADINKCIESTLNIVWNEIKYRAKVRKEYGQIPEVFCYPQQLNQVFANLLVNAAQAITEHGEIGIKTCMNNENIVIELTDTGCGIAKEDIGRVFDPFFTTKEVGKGTGLGLNVAYNIIKRHKGEIAVTSERGCGTTFIINIPANNNDEPLKSVSTEKRAF